MKAQSGNIRAPYYGYTLFDQGQDPVGMIRRRICDLCGLAPDAYDEAHYNLAEDWFRAHGYYEFTATVFILSKTYHRWWNWQLIMLEREFLRKYEDRGVPPRILRVFLFQSIKALNIHPSAELRRSMHREGMAALDRDPDLEKIKLYRHGSY